MADLDLEGELEPVASFAIRSADDVDEFADAFVNSAPPAKPIHKKVLKPSADQKRRDSGPLTALIDTKSAVTASNQPSNVTPTQRTVTAAVAPLLPTETTTAIVSATDIVIGEDEWAAANKQRDAEISSLPLVAAITAVSSATIREDLFASARSDVARRKRIVTVDTRNIGLYKRIKYAVSGLPRLTNQKVKDECDDIFTCALTPLDTAQPLHQQLMSKLYTALVDTTAEVPMVGSHWEAIGFQGSDPTTDVRGAGILGPLQLLTAIEQELILFKQIFSLSKDEKHHFPFAIVALNITGIVIQYIRTCALYNIMNKRGECFTVCNALYIALFKTFYTRWTSKQCTIVDWNATIDYLKASALQSGNKFVKETLRS